MDVILDRFEGDFAVCELPCNDMITIKKEMLPKGVKEGDVLTIFGKQVTINEQRTKERDEGMDRLMGDLWEN